MSSILFEVSRSKINIAFDLAFLTAILFLFSSVALADCTCVDFNDDGDTDDAGECVCIEDAPDVPVPSPPVEEDSEDNSSLGTASTRTVSLLELMAIGQSLPTKRDTEYGVALQTVDDTIDLSTAMDSHCSAQYPYFCNSASYGQFCCSKRYYNPCDKKCYGRSEDIKNCNTYVRCTN